MAQSPFVEKSEEAGKSVRFKQSSVVNFQSSNSASVRADARLTGTTTPMDKSPVYHNMSPLVKNTQLREVTDFN